MRDLRAQKMLVSALQNIFNRFKQWGVLKQIFRGDITQHGDYFRFCCFVTQLCIMNGEPLFSVDYEDPDYDNLYFQDRHIGDNDDDVFEIL